MAYIPEFLTWNPYRLAYSGMKSFKEGERKFFKIQNLTGVLVVFITESIMIFSSRSYRWPVATQKMLRPWSSSTSVPADPAN